MVKRKNGEKMHINESYQPGEVVYIIIRNPHAQDVAHVQQAAVVENPDQNGELALFIHETYFPLTEEFAVYKSAEEAEEAYQVAFGLPETEDYYG
ncbi:transcriptional regulator [Oceanobacillus picturae]|uniref:Transcriptional regulator n=2 Tax=Bacillaceae TaxID=186817 RepID=W9B7D6_9BACI|nr:transcriptional regulator SplA domain-containing protein [Oceanobacillus picturae]GAQ18298.1 transcriptional regulator [Oceanobacillus picturae]CDO02530.1 Transcriptional regulator protein (SplA) [Oceanobacillus picturae]